MKKLLYFLSISLFFLIGINNVSADTVTSYYVQDTSSTKETYWNAGDSYTYTDQYINYDSSSEKYVTLSTCLTGSLNLQITDNTAGSIRYLDYYNGERCPVQGYYGIMYYYVFYVDEFDYLPPDTYVNYFSLKVLNTESYRVVQDIFSVYTTSFNPLEQNQTNEQLGDINNSLGDINSNINDTNDKLDNLNDNITSEVGPDTSALSDVAGWLPPGPVDSLINLPLSLFNSISRDLSSSCQPITLPLPYINSDLTLPCMSTFYDGIGIGDFMNWIGIISSGFILFSYLMKLYKWVDDTLTFRENNHLDNWGGV